MANILQFIQNIFKKKETTLDLYVFAKMQSTKKLCYRNKLSYLQLIYELNDKNLSRYVLGHIFLIIDSVTFNYIKSNAEKLKINNDTKLLKVFSSEEIFFSALDSLETELNFTLDKIREINVHNCHSLEDFRYFFGNTTYTQIKKEILTLNGILNYDNDDVLDYYNSSDFNDPICFNNFIHEILDNKIILPSLYLDYKELVIKFNLINEVNKEINSLGEEFDGFLGLYD
jgi:hypothetical protein